MVEEVDTGLFILSGNLSPQEVALAVYGDVRRYGFLMEHNADTEWSAGSTIEVPGKKGRTSVVQEDETTTSLIQRMFPGQPSYLFVEGYLKWNANLLAEELVGKTIFIPNR